MSTSSKLVPCLGFSIFLFAFSLTHAQEKVRMVDEYRYKDAPITIVAMDVGEKRFRNNKVLAESNWLEKLRFSVKNVSGQEVRAFDLRLFLEGNGDSSPVSFPVLFRTYTRLTAENALSERGEIKLGTLKVGEVVKVRISEQHLRLFGDMLKRYGREDVNRARLYIQSVTFEDGSRWEFGKTLSPEPGASEPNAY